MDRYDGGSDDPSAGPDAAGEEEQVRSFWRGMLGEVEQVGGDFAEFKNHQLPLARIKKIMKSDEDVRMISAEAPVLFAKACELFILELSLKAWLHAERGKRRTLQRSDIAAVVNSTYTLDFLQDIIPQEEDGPKPDGGGGGGGGGGGASGSGAAPAGAAPGAGAALPTAGGAHDAAAAAAAAGAAAAGGGAQMAYYPYPTGMPVGMAMPQMPQPVDPVAFMAAQQQMQQQWAAQAAAMQAAAMGGGGGAAGVVPGAPQLPAGDASSQL
ncbi:MAG: histone-fold-containing protein [Monoraphidium minutum]|nr:MAG: histone-fold-containing protein [Monoraphidium minutum]